MGSALVFFQWAGAALGLWGAKLVGDKRRVGFAVFLAADAFTSIQLFRDHIWGTLALIVAFGLMNVRGWVKWKTTS